MQKPNKIGNDFHPRSKPRPFGVVAARRWPGGGGNGAVLLPDLKDNSITTLVPQDNNGQIFAPSVLTAIT
jgi:hypothetical protein